MASHVSSEPDLLTWALGGGVGTFAVTTLGLWKQLRDTKREDRTAEATASDAAWSRVEALIKDQHNEIVDLRAELNGSEERRVQDGDDCEKRIRAVRVEAQAENDALRADVRKLSNLCHSQQLDLDQLGNEISVLKRREAAAEAIAGGRRASDPPTVDSV